MNLLIKLRRCEVSTRWTLFIFVCRDVYVDKVTSGFLLWKPQLKAYLKVPEGNSPITWEQASRTILETLGGLLDSGEICSQLVTLWAQESSQSEGKPEIRNDHVQFTKSLGTLYHICCADLR
jgi:proteasome activator subunit 4